MTNTAPQKKPWRAIAATIIATLVSATAIHAQSTGTIEARVYNPVSKEYVRNAEVRLVGTNQVDYTENDGSFQFYKVAPGAASVSITYTGYTPVTETFNVTAGATATREIDLVSLSGRTPKPDAADQVVKLQAFAVSSEREGNAKAIMTQRRNMDITTSVSSDIFGDVTDGNVGEFLKYLPGVDLDYVESEARGPRLGGMDSQYVGVSFDGIRTASADANRGGDSSRATSFEGFSITSIESIEISRTTSAESDADSPAGTINMKTRRAFDRKGRRMSFNSSINFNTEEFTLRKTPGPNDRTSYKWKPNLSLEYSQSMLNQRLGILFSASRANSYTEQYSFVNDYNRNPTTTDPRPLVVRQIDFKDGPKNILKDAVLFTVDFKATPRLVLSANAIYTYTEGEFWNRNFTFVAANNNANVLNGRSTVQGDGLTTVRTQRTATNTVPTLNNGGGSSAKLTYTRTFAPKFEYKLGAFTVDGALTYSKSVNNYEALERGFSSSESGGVASDFTATRSDSGSHKWVIRQTSGPDWYDLANFTRNNNRDGGTRVNNSGRTYSTEIWNAQLNGRWALPFKNFPTVIKMGGKWNEENRRNQNIDSWMIWNYTGPGGNVLRGYDPITGVPLITSTGNWANLGYVSPHAFDTGTTGALTVFNIAGQPGMPPRADRNGISGLFHAHPELFVKTSTPGDYYTSFVANNRNVRQTVTAGYSQADVRVTSKLQIRFGVRLENTKNRFREVDPRLKSELAAKGFPTNTAGRATTYEGLEYQYFSKPPANRTSEYHNWFPSVLGKYKIRPNLEFQFGFNKAISRPPIDQLTGVFDINEDIERVTAPNAALLPEYSKNYQARLSYYFEPSGQLSVGVSQNDIRNLRQTLDFTSDEFGNQNPDLDTYTFRTTSNSLEERRFRNFEVAYNQTLAFLPDLFRSTSLGLTYNRSYASQRRQGLAPHRVTARLGYAYRRFSGSLGMVWKDNTAWSNEGRYQRHLTQFDTQVSWRLTSHLSVYVQGRNILKQPVRWYESAPGTAEGTSGAIRQYQYYGANWVVGLKGTF
jgi:iron complex outermembrane receptor protein